MAPTAFTNRTRRAEFADIPGLIEVRLSVAENRLGDPARVTADHYRWFIEARHLWLREEAGRTLGFSASDRRDGTIRALFLRPEAEGRGLGRALLDLAVADLWADGFDTARLTTAPGSRAAALYARAGWVETGPVDKGEIGGEIGFALARPGPACA